MKETRIEGKCSCGVPVTKILNSIVETMWLNGDRYIHTDEGDDHWCVYRCQGCKEPVDETFSGSK